MSLSLPASINPKPLSVSRLMVPSAIVQFLKKKCAAALPENTAFRLLHCQHAILSGRLAAINWQQAMARARERIWSTGGAKDQHVSLQCIDLRRLAAGMGVRLKERGKLTSRESNRLGEKSIIEDSVLRMLGVCSDSSSTDARRSQPRRNQLAITKPRQLSC